jgi:preprotein translocase subunit SecA
MFQDMMDRIEDETIKYLYFMRIETGMPALPYPEIVEPEDEELNGTEPRQLSEEEIEEQQRKNQQSVLDLTRNIQRRKDKELADLQFSSGDGSGESKTVSNKGPKVGRNELCPCGSGKKYKKCHGAAA